MDQDEARMKVEQDGSIKSDDFSFDTYLGKYADLVA